MSSNRLKLNPSKTQYIWIGNKIQLAKIDRQALLQRFPGIVFETSVIDLGVVIDEELKMDAHVGRITRSCFYQLRQIRTIRQSLSDSAIRTLIHSFVVTRIDYCNSVLSGITAVQTERVQRILNAAARLVLRIPKFAPVFNADQRHLHWLQQCIWIKFKILQLLQNCIHQRAPLYLQELCVLVFGGTGASTIAICRPILSGGQSLSIIIDAEAGFAVADRWHGMICLCCTCLHSPKQKQLQDIDQDTFVQFGNKVTIWNSFRTVH